jgi:uncharacterized ion transporter superfamily protein YfcC
MKRIAFPDALVLIFSMIVLAQIATWLLPAGEYDREQVPSVAEGPESVTLPAGSTI